ncbi:MAG: efflux RND transporter periplasmic adaptor subunit [bacterium]|uniref:Efflux RND transporter periplasmic adaptor subunit n=1 Tax=Candidatus Aphodosoma intestinipullorum TaxID=2840674 RepID=A0A940DLY1_9BACT|nr:efflux RND transporter periplasmic adaptor subunit [Candidatus Aphodosoma intestinipullorum]
MKRKLVLTTISFACLLTGLTLVSCGKEQGTAATANYKTMEVSRADRMLSRSFTAVVNGRQSVEIRPQVSGTITKVCISEGALVKKDQPLFIIDQVPYQAALQTAEASVKSAEAAVATAKLTAESKEQLFKENVVSAFDLQTAKNAQMEAEAALALAEAQRVDAANNLSYTVVKSPVDGVASMIPYRVGALVSSSIATPLVTVSDGSEMYVYFSMTENQVLAMSRKDGNLVNAVENMPEVELKLSDGSMYNHKGKVDAMSGTIDKTTGAVSVRATFPNPDGILRDGGSGVVVMPYAMDNVIVIPQEATFELQDKVFVYKVIDGKTSSAVVDVYPINNGTEYIVESGLSVGDVIIAEGAGLVKEGIAVNVRTADSASGEGEQE